MDKRKRQKSSIGDDSAHPDPGDIADVAQQQMPGKPPNLTFDPSKRYEELAREAGERALAEAARRKKTT